MSLEEKVTKILDNITTAIESMDKMNKRLTNAIALVAICMSLFSSIAIVSLAYLYFRTDYQYGVVNQTQGGESNTQKVIDKGGDR